MTTAEIVLRLLAPAVAVLLATAGYLWQKRKEQSQRIQDERRATVVNALGAVEALFQRVEMANTVHSAGTDISVESIEVAKAVAKVHLYDNEDLASRFRTVEKAVRGYHRSLAKRFSLRPEGEARVPRTGKYGEACDLVDQRRMAVIEAQNQLMAAIKSDLGFEYELTSE